MKPDTILEALIGKIAKDEDCVAANVQPETKLEKFIDKIRTGFSLAPATNKFTNGAYLISTGESGTKWQKPQNVIFQENQGTTWCSTSFSTLAEAHSKNIMIDAYLSDIENGHFFPLQITNYEKVNNITVKFVFSGIALIPDGNGGIVTKKTACSIDSDDTILIETVEE